MNESIILTIYDYYDDALVESQLIDDFDLQIKEPYQMDAKELELKATEIYEKYKPKEYNKYIKSYINHSERELKNWLKYCRTELQHTTEENSDSITWAVTENYQIGCGNFFITAGFSGSNFEIQ